VIVTLPGFAQGRFPMTKAYARPHEYRVDCSECKNVTVVHTRRKRQIKRCPRCGAKRPFMAVIFLITNTENPVVR
jgi:ribosomal protein L37AE/L43A